MISHFLEELVPVSKWIFRGNFKKKLTLNNLFPTKNMQRMKEKKNFLILYWKCLIFLSKKNKPGGELSLKLIPCDHLESHSRSSGVFHRPQFFLYHHRGCLFAASFQIGEHFQSKILQKWEKIYHTEQNSFPDKLSLKN